MDLTQFRVVPVEATQDMVDNVACGPNVLRSEVYGYMIDAAPTENVPVLIDPVELAALRKDAERYREVRCWSPAIFTSIYVSNIKTGRHFDEMVDQMRRKDNEPLSMSMFATRAEYEAAVAKERGE